MAVRVFGALTRAQKRACANSAMTNSLAKPGSFVDNAFAEMHVDVARLKRDAGRVAKRLKPKLLRRLHRLHRRACLARSHAALRPSLAQQLNAAAVFVKLAAHGISLATDDANRGNPTIRTSTGTLFGRIFTDENLLQMTDDEIKALPPATRVRILSR